MVFRCFSEKKTGFDIEAGSVYSDLSVNLGIKSLEYVRIINRYDVEGLDQNGYDMAKTTVFSEPQCDLVYDEMMPLPEGPHRILAIEALPGQFDQRADSCAQCIQLLLGGARVLVSAAKIYVLGGSLSDEDYNKVKNYLINPVESREASLEKPDTLSLEFEPPADVPVIKGFTGMDKEALLKLHKNYGLAMDMDDLIFLQGYFIKESRDPTETELRVIDTYWSDHCRHTTFGTHLNEITFSDERVKKSYANYLAAREEVYGADSTRPVTLMDIATMGVKLLKKRGLLKALDESEEINACSIKVEIEVDGEPQQWLLMFKNETHNHPTEIEPFGGAATCIGGAIRDPLSGRSYVYQAMRITGSGDPRVPIPETLEGKLPQRKLTTTAAAGYSSYGNQIGLATGIVREFYHPGYIAKRMEIGAVVGAAASRNVVRKAPVPGDVVVLIGGRTGRDGIGGATGSSKTHDLKSLDQCASEVQKGNAPEERKLQRLFRNPEVTRVIKRCNDFGAGGVSVAIGELADGLDILLDRVPKKYEGLDGTELAISESQERMAVVVAPEHLSFFMEAANAENLEATPVAYVKEEPRLTMHWRGKVIADIAREFLNTNGAPKSASAHVTQPTLSARKSDRPAGFKERMVSILTDLDHCGQRGLVERFDGSIGSGSVLMPFGGARQKTPAQVMAALFPVLDGHTKDASVMSYSFDPWLSESSPYDGATDAVTRSVAKLIAAGAEREKIYLTLQEYFPRLYDSKERWGLPVAALLGAFEAQRSLGIAAIGGKDSMSGSFLDMDVPPTLVSFAIAHMKGDEVVSNELKAPGNYLYLFDAQPDSDGLPDFEALKALWRSYRRHVESGHILSAMVPEFAGTDALLAALTKMSFGNGVGISITTDINGLKLSPGAIIAETGIEIDGALLLGRSVNDGRITVGGESAEIDYLISEWEKPLEKVFPTRVKAPSSGNPPVISFDKRVNIRPKASFTRPRAVIPVFPGTNCEYDTYKALKEAGAEPEILLIRNLTADTLAESARALENAIRSAQMIVVPGGFSGGDEPDGSGKFIAAFFRNSAITDAVHDLLHRRDGLMLGICNGFQALIKLGLLPFGEIREMDDTCPTLTYNLIGRHQSRYVTTRVSSVKSPWLSYCEVGDLHVVPVSHGEGRFVASDEMLRSLMENGQIAFQYTDEKGVPCMDIDVNPNGSVWAIEGITSPDGRVLGKMCHTERRGELVARNIPGNKFQPVFEGGVRYFK